MTHLAYVWLQPRSLDRRDKNTAGDREDADDSNGQLVPQLTLIIGVILKFPNVSKMI